MINLQTMGTKMKYASVALLTITIVGSVVTSASARHTSCSEIDMSKMTVMIGAMADGPHKWAMYRHLAEINFAMSRDGLRGCDAAMANIMRRMDLAF